MAMTFNDSAGGVVVTGPASVEEPDSFHEIVRLAGLDVSGFFERGAPLRRQHQQDVDIGRVLELSHGRVNDGVSMLWCVAQLDGPDNQAAVEAADALRWGELIGFSIGFVALERAPGEVRRAALMEVSLVSSPSCTACKITDTAASRLGLDLRGLLREAITRGVRAALAR